MELVTFALWLIPWTLHSGYIYFLSSHLISLAVRYFTPVTDSTALPLDSDKICRGGGGWGVGGVFCSSKHQFPPNSSPPVSDTVHSQTPPQCGSGGVTAGPGGLGKHWPIQPTHAPHWVVQGSRGTSGHITALRSCFMSNNSHKFD